MAATKLESSVPLSAPMNSAKSSSASPGWEKAAGGVYIVPVLLAVLPVLSVRFRFTRMLSPWPWLLLLRLPLPPARLVPSLPLELLVLRVTLSWPGAA